MYQSQPLISLEEAEEYNIDLQEVTPLSAITSFWNKDARLCGSMELGIYFAIENGFASYIWNGEDYTAEFYSDEFSEADVIADIKATHAELNDSSVSGQDPQSISKIEFKEIKCRVESLPEGHNFMGDFLDGIAGLQASDLKAGVKRKVRILNSRIRFYSRIEELEEMAATGQLV